MYPEELTHETGPLNAFFEAVSEHQWEETAVVAQPLPVHPSHDLPTLFFCCGTSLWGLPVPNLLSCPLCGWEQ